MKRTTLNTNGLLRMARTIAKLGLMIEQLIPDMFDELVKLEKNHKNIVAAHKAHTTMAKRGKAILPQRTQRSQRKK